MGHPLVSEHQSALQPHKLQRKEGRAAPGRPVGRCFEVGVVGVMVFYVEPSCNKYITNEP